MQSPLKLMGCWLGVFLMGGCGSSLEEMFVECKQGIDANRLVVREIGHYSYSYPRYRECMRPVDWSME